MAYILSDPTYTTPSAPMSGDEVLLDDVMAYLHVKLPALVTQYT
jgi:hypothetical protein